MGALAEVGLLVRVSPLPITTFIRAPDLETVDLQPDRIVGERVIEGDLRSVVGADIVPRIDDWLDTILAEPMTTGSLKYNYA